jgi:hypothetical protein
MDTLKITPDILGLIAAIDERDWNQPQYTEESFPETGR